MMNDTDKIMQRVAWLQSEQGAPDAQVAQALKDNHAATQKLKAKNKKLLESYLRREPRGETAYSMLPAAASHGNQYVLHFGMENENQNPQFFNLELHHQVIEEAREKYQLVEEYLEAQHQWREWIVEHMTSCTDTLPELENMKIGITICQGNLNLLGMKMDYLARHNVDFDLVERVRHQMILNQMQLDQFKEFCSNPTMRANFYEQFHGIPGFCSNPESHSSEGVMARTLNGVTQALRGLGRSYAGGSVQSKNDPTMPQQDTAMLDEIDEIGMLLEDGNPSAGPSAGPVLTSASRPYVVNFGAPHGGGRYE